MTDYRTRFFNNSHPSWHPFLNSVSAILDVICERLADWEARKVDFTPPLASLTMPLKMPVRAVRVVAVGQDPYTTPGAATGLAFASNVRIGRKYPDSLQKIMALTGCQDPTLMSWFGQGVMMLNTLWTATPEGVAKDPAHRFWLPFTYELIKWIVAHHAREGLPLVAMLWGNDAKSLAPLFEVNTASKARPAIFSWTHPSGNADAVLPEPLRWPHNTNFADANAALTTMGSTPIVWATKQFEYSWPLYLCFTDGACTNNGKPDARAGVGAVILKRETPTGTRPLMEIAYAPVKRISAPFPAEKKATNQCAELLAIWYALREVVKLGLSGPPSAFNGLAIVSDSAYSINALTGTNNVYENKELINAIGIEINGLIAIGHKPIFSHAEGHVLTKHMAENQLPTGPGNYAFFINAWQHESDRLAVAGRP